MLDTSSNERIDDQTPTSIIQLFLTPYLEFSLMVGSKDDTLLDIACGNCFQKNILISRFLQVTLVDKDIPDLPEYELDNFKQLDIEKVNRLPFSDSQFDWVFSFETIEHLDGTKQRWFVSELLRVGKNVIVGSVSVNGPNYINGDLIFKKATGTNSFHKKEFTSWEWKKFFDSYGHKDMVKISYFHNDGRFIRLGLNDEFGFCNYVMMS